MRPFRQIFCLKILILFMALLRKIQAEIERRNLSGGGWASGNGRTAAVETTCYALMALQDSQSPARDKGIDQLIRTQNPDGSWPAFQGDDRKPILPSPRLRPQPFSSMFSSREQTPTNTMLRFRNFDSSSKRWGGKSAGRSLRKCRRLLRLLSSGRENLKN
jgi:hypothetical protein